MPLTEEQVWEKLRYETPFYARAVAKIIDKRSELIAIDPRPAQLKVDAALEEQRKKGLPERVIVLKSRQTGISTYGQIKLVQRATLRPNRRCLTVAQDNDTSGALFGIGHTVYVNLPSDPPELKPDLVSMRNSMSNRMMHFGEKSKAEQARGNLGVNSTMRIDTAKEVQAGRGKTITDLALTEVAFWPDPNKALSLLNAVPDQPGTLVIIESTANGANFFKSRWERAENGEGMYVPVFIGWPEDPDCVRLFATPEDRAQFIESIGTGPYGADEPRLVEHFGCTPEQLYWRRVTIVDKCDGDLNKFKQEYPSSPGEAFIGSGKHVFSFGYIQNVLDLTEHTDPPASMDADKRPLGDGLFVPSGTKNRNVRDGTVEIPTGALWVPQSATGFDARKDFWRVWEHPSPEGQYVIAADVAGGEEETSTGDLAWHAIQVINHHTLEQCAEWRSRIDPDLMISELFLAGLYFNEATIAVETTGHWGVPVVTGLWKRMGYRRLYRRRPVGQVKEKQQELLGWDTNRRTKPSLEAGMGELLREGTHGIRSSRLARELVTYVRDPNGRSGPDTDAFSDLLMAYMIGQHVAQQLRPRHERAWNKKRTTYAPKNPVTGY